MNYEELVNILHRKNLQKELLDINCTAFEILAKEEPKVYEQLIAQLEILAHSIGEEEAISKVRNMKPFGQAWSIEQISEMMQNRNISGNVVDWYLVVNMCYNDYYNTAKQYGLQNDENFYFNLAKDFIEDPDAEPFKVARYFE